MVGNIFHIPTFSGGSATTKVIQIPPTFGSGVLALIWYRPEAISSIMENLKMAKNTHLQTLNFLQFDMKGFWALGLPLVVF